MRKAAMLAVIMAARATPAPGGGPPAAARTPTFSAAKADAGAVRGFAVSRRRPITRAA
jgi:hypothetical protein